MPSGRPKPPFRVQIVVNPDQEYFREAVLGVRHYGFETGRLVFADRWLKHELGDLARMVRRDGVQGIVAAAHTPAMEAALAKAGVPVVNVSNSMRVPRLPVVTQDDVAVGRLAAEHLRDCGCRSFGFWGQAETSYARQRWQGFRDGLADSGAVPRAEESRTGEAPARTFERMRKWLAGLERPAGVFAAMDNYALVMLRAAREEGWRVPEDIAVLGAGDDDFFVEFERVPLSSIRLPSRNIGYEAGALIDRLITSGRTTAESVQLPVGEIAIRRSTDVQFVDDPVVARAVRMMRAQPGVRVAEIARAAGMARSGLQRRFLRALGRGMREEIQRVRMTKARMLLSTTSAKLDVVAEQSGFASVQRLSAQFRRLVGVAPGKYRRGARER
ncbi:MAG: substrate-binding domain-containing protein [Opitutaceae bacterium]|jgi:LacI family transcriptional regulator